MRTSSQSVSFCMNSMRLFDVNNELLEIVVEYGNCVTTQLACLFVSIISLLIMAVPPAQKNTGFTEDIDFKKVIREAVAAQDAEDKYQRENDAKFRAVYQKVATYEEFCDIVLASNLRPLDKSDSIPTVGAGPSAWNVTASNTSKQKECDETRYAPDVLGENMPVSCQAEFNKLYKRLNPSDKYSLLLEIGGNKLLSLFPTEIEVFEDILLVLTKEYKQCHVHNIVNILLCISEMKRFSLTLQFLDKHGRNILNSLLKLLTDTTGTHTDTELAQVVSIYTNLIN